MSNKTKKIPNNFEDINISKTPSFSTFFQLIPNSAGRGGGRLGEVEAKRIQGRGGSEGTRKYGELAKFQGPRREGEGKGIDISRGRRSRFDELGTAIPRLPGRRGGKDRLACIVAER